MTIEETITRELSCAIRSGSEETEEEPEPSRIPQDSPTELKRLIDELYHRGLTFEVRRVWDGMTDVEVHKGDPYQEPSDDMTFFFDRGESFLYLSIAGVVSNDY